MDIVGVVTLDKFWCQGIVHSVHVELLHEPFHLRMSVFLLVQEAKVYERKDLFGLQDLRWDVTGAAHALPEPWLSDKLWPFF